MTTLNTDRIVPEGAWQFDSAVTAVFDDMLQRSIPNYEDMRRLCHSLGRQFVKAKTDIVDLGCSRGEALAPFVKEFGAYNRYVGCDVSAPMLEAATERFRGLIDSGIVDIRNTDLRTGFPPCSASLILCVLTLQFVPIEYRQKIIANIFSHLIRGGALILVEKVLGQTSAIDNLLVDTYLETKRAHGYTEDQIQRKRMSLEGVLVPVTATANADMLKAEGFGAVDVFWRHLNFTGFLAIKT